jgi:cytoskeletal protein RodZ
MAAGRQGRRARARERAEAESALAAQADYAGVGATLRTARERNGFEVAAVATTLRVQPAHLIAIEQGRFAELPGQVYAIGFLRSYAEYLGFDGEAAVRRVKEEMSGEDGRAARLTFPVPVAEARTPGPRLLLFAMVAAVAIYGAWVYWGRVQTGTVELVPPLPERLARLIGDSSSQPAFPAAAAPVETASPPAPLSQAAAPPLAAPTVSLPAPLPAPTVSQSAPAAAPAPPLVALAPVGAEVVPPPAPAPPAPTPQIAAVASPAPAPAFPTVSADPAPTSTTSPPLTPTFGVPANESRITLRARSISWVQVRGGDNEILITRTLKAGDTYFLPNRGDLVMMTGSAGGLEVLVDGKPIPTLGAVGEVKRNIALDPERLLRLTAQQ